jgi:hypothetical protein
MAVATAIEVRTARGANVIDTAECDTPEAALTAARALWDDAAQGSYYAHHGLRVMFHVDGVHVRTVEGRP